MASRKDQFLLGLRAGLLATVPMTLFMWTAHELFPTIERRPLPPERVADRLLRKLGVRHRFGPAQFVAAATALHFGFGGTMGGVFGLLGGPATKRPVVAAVAFGQCVWAASYKAGLPLTELYPPPHRQRLGRQAVLVGSHLVWGTTLGLLSDRTRERRNVPMVNMNQATTDVPHEA